MAHDWAAVLAKQSELAKMVETTTTEVLNIPELAPEEVFRLYRLVESGAGEMDRIVVRMEESGAELRLLEWADRLMEVWTRLCVATAYHIQSSDGAEPFELAEDDDMPWPLELVGNGRAASSQAA